MSLLDLRDDIMDVIRFLAGKKTTSEIMFGDGHDGGDYGAMSVEERIREMGRRRIAHDEQVHKARSLLIRLGEGS